VTLETREDICDMSVGKAIARYRKKKAMTQMDLASTLNVHQSQIARWETGRSLPRKEYLEELSEALEVTVEQLFHSEPHDFGRLDDDELRTLLFEIPNLSKRQQDTLKNILQDMVKLSRFQEVMRD
jgi:transcriptional regulator with XRE-family HTH domain